MKLHLVAADVRRLISIFDFRFSIFECRMPNFKCRTSGSRPQCASRSWRSKLPVNLPSLVAADVRRLTSFAAHPQKIARLSRTRIVTMLLMVWAGLTLSANAPAASVDLAIQAHPDLTKDS